MNLKKENVLINKESVSITLFVPLCPKAVETKRKNPIITDQKALEIIESIELDVKPYLQKRAYHSAIVRTWVIDRGVTKFIEENPEGLIINLGCGLDTRITRVDNGKIQWIDLDLPDVIELRRKFFSENNRIKFISKSVTDYSWMEDIKVEGRKVLLIAEGLFPYFQEAEIKEIFQHLVNNFDGAEMYLTVLHKFLVGKEITQGTRFKWGIEDVKEIEQIHNKIKLLDFWRSSDYFKKRQNFIMRILAGLSPAGKNLNRVLHIKLGS